ncbi:type I-F CRISPR-associated endoribonuclease Cas6/Csy4 [Rosistilla oblonga]|uniref:type I-F CRISPR-associated endoribonuclease Cas6/Csy4 n=1 Tax=Rosistilla oblonga TaxID=2527990 RepID=UPI003A977DDC
MQPSFYYQEVTCLPDHEISVGFVMGKVMEAVHLALVNVAAGSPDCPIGISFPEYRDPRDRNERPLPDRRELQPPHALPIGSKLRLFSRQQDDLNRLGLTENLARLSDYVHLTSAKLLQRKIDRFAAYQRVQPKSSKERLIRRQMKRKGISEAEARAQYASFEPHHSKLPYLNLRSHSTGERFRLYVQRQVVELGEPWLFSTYGLSASAGVPEF